MDKIESAPMPHPYPQAAKAQYVQSPISDTFDPTQTITTNHKETSPAISDEDRFVAYVQTDSSKKLEKLMAWSSPSPVAHINAHDFDLHVEPRVN